MSRISRRGKYVIEDKSCMVVNLLKEENAHGKCREHVYVFVEIEKRKQEENNLFFSLYTSIFFILKFSC